MSREESAPAVARHPLQHVQGEQLGENGIPITEPNQLRASTVC